jgi:hypothetical protein
MHPMNSSNWTRKPWQLKPYPKYRGRPRSRYLRLFGSILSGFTKSRNTSDYPYNPIADANNSGFLPRSKSLRGGRRRRNVSVEAVKPYAYVLCHFMHPLAALAGMWPPKVRRSARKSRPLSTEMSWEAPPLRCHLMPHLTAPTTSVYMCATLDYAPAVI